MRISQKLKGAIMCNMCDTVFSMRTNVLQNFDICISVPLRDSVWVIRCKALVGMVIQNCNFASINELHPNR